MATRLTLGAELKNFGQNFVTELKQTILRPSLPGQYRSAAMPAPRILGIHPLWVNFEWVRFMFEARMTLRHMQDMGGIPKGNGENVVLIPAMPLGEFSCYQLELFLKQAGYCVHPICGRGLIGTLRKRRETITKRALELSAQNGPLVLIGHSLGGCLAREIAEKHPEAVKLAITLGMPKSSNILGMTYPVQGPNRLRAPLHQKGSASTEPMQAQAKPTIVNIWSRNDGLVSPSDVPEYEISESLEVRSSHMGMIFNWNVFEVVARTLHRNLGPMPRLESNQEGVTSAFGATATGATAILSA